MINKLRGGFSPDKLKYTSWSKLLSFEIFHQLVILHMFVCYFLSFSVSFIAVSFSISIPLKTYIFIKIDVQPMMMIWQVRNCHAFAKADQTSSEQMTKIFRSPIPIGGSEKSLSIETASSQQEIKRSCIPVYSKIRWL